MYHHTKLSSLRGMVRSNSCLYQVFKDCALNVMRLRFISFLVLCMLCSGMTIEGQNLNNDQIQVIQPTKVKFKKRSSLVSRMMNDFDKSEVHGYRCLLTFYFTNNERTQRTIAPNCFCLKDEAGNEFDELDTESSDFRSDLLTGPCAVSPHIPHKIKLTFIVPDKNRKYALVFKGYK